MGFVRSFATGLLLGLASAAPALQQRDVQARSQNITTDPTTNLPVVDLGYELHRAQNYDASGDFYNFTNIRFAAPPVGELRFRKPVPPFVNRTAVQTGDVTQNCLQAYPTWEDEAEDFVISYLFGGIPKKVRKRQAAQANQTTIQSEDCLFLDVVVPKPVFEAEGKGAPVLVWIYGGGYTDGSKGGSTSGDPEGLLQRSNNSIIYVALNYRLGAFGWLGGPIVQADGDANVGLYDQRLALQWVQDHIEDFGGDPDRVTVIGESAGGGSILHQITAFGGKQPSLFKQAIPQSPGFTPWVSANQTDSTLAQFLSLAGVSTLEEARQLPTEKLQAANSQQISNAPYGSFIYGPSVDGDLVPRLPAELLSTGDFNTDIRVLVGHNSDEGLIFVHPNAVNVSSFEANVEDGLPTLPQADLDYLNNTLYPANFNGTQPYHDSIGRQATTAADIGFLCNVYALAKYTTAARVYEFAVYPGLHGQDIPYTFYNGPTANATTSATSNTASRIKSRMTEQDLVRRQSSVNEAAISLQQWIVTFASAGTPSDSLGPAFPLYGPQQNILKLTADAAPPSAAMDDISAARCNWWIQKGFVDLVQ